MVKPGSLIVDNSALAQLEAPEAKERFLRNLRSAGWEVWPTAVNYLEALKTKNSTVRDRLLNIIRWMCGDRGLLPWPHSMLEITGRAIYEGKSRFQIRWSGLEWHLFESEHDDEDSDRAIAFLDEQERRFQQLFDDRRGPVQAGLTQLNASPSSVSVRTFLDVVWSSGALLDDTLHGLWERLELPGSAPIDQLRELETWKLFHEAYGVMAYERSFVDQPRKRVQLMDLLQLLYLGSTVRKRAVATNDSSFRRAGNAILAGRYQRAEVCKLDAFLQ